MLLSIDLKVASYSVPVAERVLLNPPTTYPPTKDHLPTDPPIHRSPTHRPTDPTITDPTITDPTITDPT